MLSQLVVLDIVFVNLVETKSMLITNIKEYQVLFETKGE